MSARPSHSRACWTACSREKWAAGLIALALALAACGYRPATRLVDDVHSTALIPAFTSYVAEPELDVFAGDYLAARLTAMGVGDTSDPATADMVVRGILLRATEMPVALHPGQTLVQLLVDVRVEVAGGTTEPCVTSTVQGAATMSVPLAAVSEPERLTALQSATAEAIDELVLDVLLCVRQVGAEP